MTEPNSPFQQKLESVSRSAGVEIPVDRIALPSKGLIYPVGHPLCNEDAVDVKCLCAAQEDILTSSALIRNGTVLTKLMESCLLNKTIEPDTLILGDRNAILIAIRITGYGSDYSVKLNCDSCSQEYDTTFSLNGLKIKSLGATPLQPNANLFGFKLPVSGLDVQFKLLTGKDETEISQINDRNKKLGSQIDKSITLRLFQAIASINGETDKQKLNYTINNLRAGDARALRKYILEISPNVDMKQWSKCPHCGVESEVEVPLGINFFWPDLR
jgi:hypothetical protein